jgi:predicted AAA+ superfamily ATPase
MQKRRSAPDLIKDIVTALRAKPLSYRALDIMLGTSSRSISSYVELLEDLGICEIEFKQKGIYTHRYVHLTEYGKGLKFGKN